MILYHFKTKQTKKNFDQVLKTLFLNDLLLLYISPYEQKFSSLWSIRARLRYVLELILASELSRVLTANVMNTDNIARETNPKENSALVRVNLSPYSQKT